MADRETMSAEELEAKFKELSNWGRWGPDDELCAPNLITPDRRAAAAALVADGVAVSCSLSLPTRPAPANPTPVRHAMKLSLQPRDLGRLHRGDKMSG